MLRKLLGMTPVLLMACLLAQSAARAQEIAWRTSDDTRRVPLPPADTSKDEVLLITGGTLIDGRKGAPKKNAVVVVRGDRIVAVGQSPNVEVPAHVDKQIDASGLYIVPGLIDLHIHFTQQRGEDFSRYRDTDVAAAIRATLLLGQFLDAGITAVRDVGTSNDVALRIKEAVERHLIDGPRVLWSGQLIASRGGHADEITSTATGRPKSLADNDRVRVANGPWDWRLAVREQIRMQADWIKLTAPYTREEIDAAVNEAHLHGIPVAVDSFGEFSQWAAEVGVDSIEHPLDLNQDIINSMVSNKTALVPTLTAFYNVITTGYPSAGIPAGGFYYTMSRRFPVDHEQHIQMVRAAHKAGVPLGVGTDIPFENERRYPEDYYVELGFLKDAGLSDEEVLNSATSVGAEILGMGDKLGTVEVGRLADLLIVGANPLSDIQNLRDVRHVIADGQVVR
ncbi:MAG: amidohydrolase family protein [Xanthomonadales bacterium]|nr:amidohydrolase family protein [Xanthomonadales bacterium]